MIHAPPTDLGQMQFMANDLLIILLGRWCLFTDNVTPDHATTLSSLHEATFPGYGRIPASWGLPYFDVDGEATVNGSLLQWQPTDGVIPNQTVYLWGFVYGTTLLFVNRLGAPFTFVGPTTPLRLFPIRYKICPCRNEPLAGALGVSGGFGIGGRCSLTVGSPLGVSGGFGVGGITPPAGGSFLPSSGGFGIGGIFAPAGGSFILPAGGFGLGGALSAPGGGRSGVSGGFGLGGILSAPGGGRSGVSGGFGVGGVVDLNGGSIYSTFSTFTAANGTTIAAYVPNVGPSWSQVSGSSTIQSNQLAVANASVQTVAAGHSDGTLTSTTTPGSGGTSITLFRYLNSTNYWQLVTNSTQLLLIKVVAGSPTVVATAAGTFTNGTPYPLSIALAAGSISGTVNGVNVSASGQSFNQTQQTMGVSGASGAWNVDNFAFAP